jgi:nucleotide-binding universal stress UspA family protein
MEAAVYKRALIPLDGSMVAEGTIPFILQTAGPLGLDVTLLRVVTPSRAAVAVEAGPVVLDNTEELCAEAEAYLVPVATELRANGIRVTTEVRRGDPVDEILAAVRDSQADLVIMTTHGRTGFGRLLFGSVAEAVLRHADVPVILMRQTEVQIASRGPWQPFR